MYDGRVLVIGLDGASWKVLEPLMERGMLPNLHRIAHGGATGILRSTIPPVTAPAWASFSTGVNPGKHGVFGFETQGSDGRGRVFVSRHSVLAPPLWRVLSEQGMRVGVINVPLTYPPEAVNGFMISGMLTPSLRSEFAYPPGLREEILAVAPDYATDVNLLSGGRDLSTAEEKLGLIGEVRAAMQSRGAVAEDLMRRHPWDFFMVVFVSMDRVQHPLWHYLHPDDDAPPPDLERIQPMIYELYSELDGIVGQLIASAGELATVIIMSDHGFGPLRDAININRWLQEQGLLAFREAKGFGRHWLLRLSEIVRWRRFVPESLRSRLRSPFEAAECIDWAHTKAYSGSPIEQGIYINTPRRRAGGIVRTPDEEAQIKQQIKRALPRLVDPTTGIPAIEAVYEAPELYSGPHTSTAPDLIFRPRESAYLTNSGTPDCDLFDRREYWPHGGYHHPDGILIMHGPSIVSGIRIEAAHIVDLTPTILHLSNLPIPGYMDGVVLRELLDLRDQTAHRLPSASSEDSFLEESC